MQVITKLRNNLPELLTADDQKRRLFTKDCRSYFKTGRKAKSQKRLALFPQAAGLAYQRDLSTVGGSP